MHEAFHELELMELFMSLSAWNLIWAAILPKVVKLEDPLTSLSSWGSHELRLVEAS